MSVDTVLVLVFLSTNPWVRTWIGGKGMEREDMPSLGGNYRMSQGISQLGFGANITLARPGLRMVNSQMLLLSGTLWKRTSRFQSSGERETYKHWATPVCWSWVGAKAMEGMASD